MSVPAAAIVAETGPHVPLGLSLRRPSPEPSAPIPIVSSGIGIETTSLQGTNNGMTKGGAYVPGLPLPPFAPSSPTDILLSPCSQRIFGKKKKMIVPPQEPLSSRSHSLSMEDMTEESLEDGGSNDSSSSGSNSAREKRCYSLESDVKETPVPDFLQGKTLILGSSSANRKQVVELLGWNFIQMSPDIDEKAIRVPDPLELPLLIARAKADAIFKRLAADASEAEAVILTADQVVLFDETVREKPESEEQARIFLKSYSENIVQTISAVVGTHYPSGLQFGDVEVAEVEWKAISDDVVDKVLARGQIFSSAGGFRVEDEDLNPLIRSIDGTVDSVFGMPGKYQAVSIEREKTLRSCGHVALIFR
jgi:septum formation protein